MQNTRFLASGAGLLLCLAAGPASGDIIEVVVRFENLAPEFGTWQTPVWVGAHNGQFDLFDSGSPASMELERLAEDGTIDPLDMQFMNSGNGFTSGVLGGGPIAPGAIVQTMLTLDTDDPRSRYFSFASMVIPSNDAFIANGNPLGHEVIDAGGNFLGADFFITGAMVYDAGTEVNDEIPENTAFFGQMNPDTGVPENGVVHLHPGFKGSFGNPGDPPMILADAMFRGADFTLPGYPIGRFTVEIVPAPSALALLGLAGLMSRRRRRVH